MKVSIEGNIKLSMWKYNEKISQEDTDMIYKLAMHTMTFDKNDDIKKLLTT